MITAWLPIADNGMHPHLTNSWYAGYKKKNKKQKQTKTKSKASFCFSRTELEVNQVNHIRCLCVVLF